MELRKATRQKAKLRIGISGASGSGKTYSALLVARGMVDDWNKIALIDTENGSGDLYAHLGEYNVITLTAPFTPERYIEAINQCEVAGMEVIVIDSATHEWDGVGGCLEIAESITQRSTSKNSYTAWKAVTPRHRKFLDTILQSSAHIIATTRRKQDYDMSKNDQGKTVITKVGMKEVQREGFEYELTVNFSIDQGHFATVVGGKDRTGLFDGKPEFVPSVETGKILRDWAEKGEQPKEQSVYEKTMVFIDGIVDIEQLRLYRDKINESSKLTPEQKRTILGIISSRIGTDSAKESTERVAAMIKKAKTKLKNTHVNQ